jgi:hypothetical protein
VIDGAVFATRPERLIPERKADDLAASGGSLEVRFDEAADVRADAESQVSGTLLHGALEAPGQQELESVFGDGHRLDLR